MPKTETKKKRRNPHLRLWVKPHQLDYRAINWYHDANALIVREYGDDADFFCKLLAATSPRKQVKANWRMADNIYRLSKASDNRPLADFLATMMPAHAINVIRTLQGRPIKGLKVNAFYQNLSGNYDAVTVDMWILLAYGFKKSLTDLQYSRLTDKIRKEAAECGLLPAQYQALIWTAIRRESGKKYVSFVAAWSDMLGPTLFDIN